jgi:tripartite-type tricarboxylate transporter receptor subunit TctC
LAAPQALADDVADFYKGKRINLIVSYGTGGGYDVYARVLARHMTKYIPGNPNIVVQNMPGAGSLRGTNYIYNVAPKDGTVFGTFARNMPLLGLIKSNQNVQFDPARFTWLGSSASFGNDAYLLMLRKDAKVKTVEDARRPGGPPIILGSTAEGASSDAIGILLREWLGFNVKVIPGYTDSGVLFLAIERGEIEGRTVGLSAVRANKPDWLKPNGLARVLVVFGRATRHPDFPDAPTARELARNAEDRNLIEIIEVPDEEFETMGPNVLALGPRRALALEGNDETRRRMEAAGVEVVTYKGDEISRKGDGGPTCLTRPILRA